MKCLVRMNSKDQGWGFMLGVFALLIAAYAFLGWLFSVVWNAICVPAFGWPTINTWQGTAIVLLGCLIFKRLHMSIAR